MTATRRARSPKSESARGILRGMARRPGSGGRPSKGDRSTLITRPPTPLAEAVRNEAERQGLSYSDYVANILAAAHGFPPITAPDPQMQLTA